MKSKHLYSLLLVVVAYVGVLVVGTRAEHRSKAMQAKLESEFATLPSFSRSTKVANSSGRKSGHGIVGASYSTSATLPDICAYYDSVLLPRGWRLAYEEPVREWGKDLGGYTINYKKDKFTASLQYAGQHAHHRWDYAFTLSWGLY